jgi:hypothetical protein
MPRATKTLPRFYKRQYEAIAQVIQGLVLSHNELSEDELDELISIRHSIAGEFADMLGRDDPRFDRDRFIHACVPGANVRARTAHIKAQGNGQLPSNEWRAR